MLILRARCSFAFHSFLCFVFASLPLLALAADAAAQPDPSGIEFITIGSPGNAPWTGGGFNNNRGRVDYEYRIGKFEVTTAQWCAFMNAAFDRPGGERIPFVGTPVVWGARSTTPNNPGGRRWTVPAGNEMIPVGGVDWRTCAIYTNWLHHSQGSARENFLSGAYDVSTFGYFMGGTGFTDQLTRSPGARYFLPSIDEWMKAAHWSPNRNGPGQGGWWPYSNGSDQPFVYGPPGVLVDGLPTTANAGWDDLSFPGRNPFAVPLGAYPLVTSPWGLFDTAGGTSEWTEATFWIPDEQFPRGRVFEGSGWGPFEPGGSDQAGNRYGSEFPSANFFNFGFRVASIVPSPGFGSLGGCVVLLSLTIRRRRNYEVGQACVVGGVRAARPVPRG